MQFIDLSAQQKRIRPEIEKRLMTVLDHGRYIMGPEIGELENALSAYVGVKHALACASGTDALLLALMTLDVGPGDAIFTTPFTFIATAEVIQLLGAVPVFVDIDPNTFNIDTNRLVEAINAVRSGDRHHPGMKCVSANESLNPKAIIPVDLFGLPADYDNINTIAQNFQLDVVEDAAQSFGALYKGKRAGALADLACTSFFPAKPLGCYGDGGMCFTDDDRYADILQSLRIHGKGKNKYDNVRIGLNGRMDTMQAAILLEKFKIFPEEVQLRNKVAGRYARLLADNTKLTLPTVPEQSTSVWAQYSILAEDENARGMIQNSLKAADVPTAVYYPKPLHLQTAFSDLGYHDGDFPTCEALSARIFSLPMHPYLSLDDQKVIAEKINQSCTAL